MSYLTLSNKIVHHISLHYQWISKLEFRPFDLKLEVEWLVQGETNSAIFTQIMEVSSI